MEQQQIVGDRLVDRDVFGLARDGGEVELQVLQVRDGRVVGAAEYGFSDVRLDDGDVMGSFLGQYYGGDAERQVPAEVLSAAEIDDGGALEALLAERAGRRVVVRTPKRGARRELVSMAAKNAELGLARRLEARESIEAALEELRERLGLASLPRRIECYDVSNLQGALAVASRVVFESGQPEKAAYRRYKIREAKGGDDLACMREVLERRLARIESEPLPDLLVVDGGKGQLGVVTALLRDRGLQVDHLGIAKQRDEESPSPRVRRSGGLKAERLFLPGRKDAVRLAAELTRPSAAPAGARRIPSLRDRLPAELAAKGGPAVDPRGASRHRARQAARAAAANGVAPIGAERIGAGSLRGPRDLQTGCRDDSRLLPGG